MKDLSPRELGIAELLSVAAMSNKELAYVTGLAEGTIKEYLYNVFRKVGVANRTELALLMRANPDDEANHLP